MGTTKAFNLHLQITNVTNVLLPAGHKIFEDLGYLLMAHVETQPCAARINGESLPSEVMRPFRDNRIFIYSLDCLLDVINA